jgi:hypothetical protein
VKNTLAPDDVQRRARARRTRSARKFRPITIHTLLVAEAPPAALDRYFYFPDVRTQDALFRYVYEGVLGRKPTREAKTAQLTELKQHGLFLIDLSEDPLGEMPLKAFVPDLVRRCQRLNPHRIILIKATVYDAAFAALREAGLPVVNERIPFPGSGRQREFVRAFGRALARHADNVRVAD